MNLGKKMEGESNQNVRTGKETGRKREGGLKASSLSSARCRWVTGAPPQSQLRGQKKIVVGVENECGGSLAKAEYSSVR